MKPTLLAGLVFLVLSHALHAERPVIETLPESKTVSFPEIQISLQLPSGAELIGPDPSDEPVNYIFPWMRIPRHGGIDLAYFPKGSDGSNFLGRVSEACRSYLDRIKTIQQEGEINIVEIRGIQFARVAFKGERTYNIIRYYFLTTDHRLAFFHLWSGLPSMDELEDIMRTAKYNPNGPVHLTPTRRHAGCLVASLPASVAPTVRGR
jgi:hypothetical protein